MATRNAIGSNIPIEVTFGGTQKSSNTPLNVMCAGTSSTTSFQQVSSQGTVGQVLTSNGAGALPTWQDSGSTPGQPTYVPLTTFVPVFAYNNGATGVTYTSRNGFYTQVGDTTYFSLRIVLSNKGTPIGMNDVAFIKGLPPRLTAQAVALNAFVIGLTSVPLPGTFVYGQMLPDPLNPALGFSTIVFVPWQNIAGSSSARIRATNISNTTEIIVSGCY